MTDAKQMRESGFTLIELIVVIVILGILAVTAAPKFMNLTFGRQCLGRKGHGRRYKDRCTHGLRQEQASERHSRLLCMLNRGLRRQELQG